MMNLDSNAIYKLTKVKTNNPESRYAKDGDTFVGQAYMVGESLVVGNIHTSTVIKVEPTGDGNYLVQTRNSVYSLVKQD